MYESSLITQGPKQFYRYINSSLKSKLQTFALLHSETNTIISDPVGVAEIFANQFCSVFTKESMTDFPELDCQQRSELFIDVIEFTPEKVQKALASLKMHASPGPNNI